MSESVSRGKGQGQSRGRGRGRGKSSSTNDASQPQILEPPVNLATEDFSPPGQPHASQEPRELQHNKPRRSPPKSVEELRRIMDIIQSRICVIIDSLEGDDSDVSLKRNVGTAVKHLKQINALLS